MVKDLDQLEFFELSDGQFFADYRYKNLQWFLNDQEIGYGDLRDVDMERIKERLKDGEEFVGWNEHHGTHWQQTKTPIVRITAEKISTRGDIVKTEGH